MSLAYQDEDKRYEVLDGKPVAMSPRPVVNHYRAGRNITRIFEDFLKGKSCEAFGDGVDLHLSKKDRVIPDAMIVCNRDIIKKRGVYGVPDLIVEVLSPSTAKNDKGYKKNLYEKCGVKEYWIVNCDGEIPFIEVYLLKEGKLELDEVYVKYSEDDLAAMTEEEKNAVVYEFAPSLFPDMTVVIEKVFEGMI